MKELIKTILAKTLLRPAYVHHSSQTVYETLLACLRMWDLAQEEKWKTACEEMVEELLAIQQPDGGFDIGYDFSFGRRHRRGESTSPELLGLIALSEYARRFGPDHVVESADRAAAWIKRFAREMPDGGWAIPYAPYSIDQIMVNNSSSYAAGALGSYLGTFHAGQANGEDPAVESLKTIYAGMTRFMDGMMSSDERLPGRFWYYADQSRDDLPAGIAKKIDYYHQMQQVEVHSLAQQRFPAPRQLDLIRSASDHIVAVQAEHDVVPYAESDAYFGGLIHTWGFASVAAGMLEASVVVPDRRDAYHAVARRVLAWLLEHAWTGDYFIPVLQPSGEPYIADYFPRSDAWVMAAFSSACVHLGDGPWQKVIEPCYSKIRSADLSGPDNHASTPLMRATGQAIRIVLGR